MKILAKRSNIILILAPLLFIAWVVYFIILENPPLDFNHRAEWWCRIGNIVLMIRFILRLQVPRVILEYDDNFLYINRRFKEPEAVAFKSIIGISTLKDKVDFREMRRYRRKIVPTADDHRDFYYSLIALATTGVININYEGGYVRLHGISNVKQVEDELFGIIRKKRKDNLDNINDAINRKMRQKELEELSKHDINT